jgi:hypothetical protein
MKNEMKDSPAALPLSDGTLCCLTEYALRVLGHEFGISSGRVKKAGSGSYDFVAVTPAVAKYPDSREVALKDLLAVTAYKIAGDPGQKFVLLDGDIRNLMPDNVALSARPEPKEPRQPKAKKTRKVVVASALPLEMQLELLALAVTGHSYVDGDGEWKKVKKLVTIGQALLRNKALAEEICGEVVLSLVEQIHAGAFRGKSTVEFFGWVRESAYRQFSKRLDGVLMRYIGDVETDPSAIRLRKAMHSEIVQAGSPEQVAPFNYQSERADAGRVIERAERAEKERKRKELEEAERAEKERKRKELEEAALALA